MDDSLLELIHRWMKRADHDLRTARLTIKGDPELTDTICFHAQQCAEKCMKAFLTFSGQHIEKTHDLGRIVQSCLEHDPDFSTLEEVMIILDRYSVGPRYPDDWRLIPLSEAMEAVRLAEQTYKFVDSKLKDKL